MRASKQVTILMALFTIGALTLRSPGSEQTASKSPSNVRQMRCVVKVTADPDVLPLSFDLVESLVQSDAVAGEAARAAWPAGQGVPHAYLDVRKLADADSQSQPADETPASESESQSPRATRTVLFELRVQLGNEMRPVARELGSAVIESLRGELQKAFVAQSEDLKRQLREAELQQEEIRKEFEEMLRRNPSSATEPIRPDEVDVVLHKQLQRVVNLSALTQQTPASEAFETIRNSIQPPLNLVVIWRDLFDNANIEPVTPVQFDGPPAVRLGTALDNICSALTDPLATTDDYRVDYVVSEGAVIVATRRGLPRKEMETRVYDLPPLLKASNQAPELAALIRATIEPESWHDFGSGDGTIAPSADGRLIVSQSRDVHIRIQELLAKIAAEPYVALPEEASQETLQERIGSLLPYRAQLEQELDHLQERQGQIARERNEKEKQATRDTLQSTASDLYAAMAELEEIHAAMAKTAADAPQDERLRQAMQKIGECMNRCYQTLSKLRNGPVLDMPSSWSDWGEERTVAERIAAKQRDLREVSRRIADLQRMLVGSKTFDPGLDQVQSLTWRWEQTNPRVQDLRTRLANLQPGTVTILGGIVPVDQIVPAAGL